MRNDKPRWHASIKSYRYQPRAGIEGKLKGCAGTISLMPGTGSNPAFRRVDVDVETGKVSGLF